MKLLWLDLNSSYAHSSLALPALHAQIKTDNSIQWHVVSATINENVGMIVSQICSYQPDLVASTCWLFNHELLLHILVRVKAVIPHCQIILGGPEFLGDNETFLRKYREINCVFRGEGERGFADWLKAWNQPDKWEKITGLCYIGKKNQYHDGGLARIADFSSLSSPQSSPFFNWEKPFVQLETTRGCFNTCAFCVSGGEKPVRTIPLSVVRQRLNEIRKHGIRNVRILDRTFNYDRLRTRKLLTLFREFSPDLCFHLEIHPALLSEDIRQELEALPKGLLHLEAGIQSLREPVLQTSRRAGKLSDSLDGLQYLCSLENMETHADLIAGLPLYRISEIFEDIRTLAEYGAAEIQLETLKLLPGTEMRMRSEELGIRYSPLPPYEVLWTPEITVDELQTSRLLSRLLDGFYNAEAWRGITQKLICENVHFLPDFLDYLIRKNVIEYPLSLEKRGLLLYAFCKAHYPRYQSDVSLSWIEAGLSLKKIPAEKVRTKRQSPPAHWHILYGNYSEELRLCFLPIEEEQGYWFGFPSESQQTKPVFKAFSS